MQFSREIMIIYFKIFIYILFLKGTDVKTYTKFIIHFE